jgi:hypothetical protein
VNVVVLVIFVKAVGALMSRSVWAPPGTIRKSDRCKRIVTSRVLVWNHGGLDAYDDVTTMALQIRPRLRR